MDFLNFFIAIGAAIVFLLIVIVTFWVFDSTKRFLRLRKKENKLKQLLAGRNLDDVLAQSPYDFGHFQGEDGYRIYDTRIKDGFIGFASTRLDAHIFILEKNEL